MFSYGVVVGGSVTNDFAPIFSAQHPTIPSFFPVRKGLIGGATVEYSWTKEFSIEVSALNRLLHATGRVVEPDGSIFAESTFPVTTWQFPVLAKYALPLASARPFFEAGPSFRTAGNLNGQDPSDLGVTAGVGVEWQFKKWAISPTLRYTRWQKDPSTKPDQIEALISLRHRADDDERPFGENLSVGVLLGTTLTPDFRARAFSAEVGPDDPLYPPGAVEFRFLRGPTTMLAGPTIEARLSNAISLEAGALYRKLRQKTEIVASDGRARTQCCGDSDIWEIPVLAKYRLDRSQVKPFVGAGPTFRTFGASDDPHFGLGVAAGFALYAKGVKVAPQVRYTRWATNAFRTKPADQVQVLLGVSF